MTSLFTRPDAPEHPPGGVRRFTAAYTSACDCGLDIEPGDHAGYIDDDTEASCPDCCDSAEDNDCV